MRRRRGLGYTKEPPRLVDGGDAVLVIDDTAIIINKLDAEINAALADPKIKPRSRTWEGQCSPAHRPTFAN